MTKIWIHFGLVGVSNTSPNNGASSKSQTATINQLISPVTAIRTGGNMVAVTSDVRTAGSQSPRHVKSSNSITFHILFKYPTIGKSLLIWSHHPLLLMMLMMLMRLILPTRKTGKEVICQNHQYYFNRHCCWMMIAGTFMKPTTSNGFS
jgi:hypothetical protein